ncbi:MAG: exodeoxyribonuclease VII large subunit [Lachnospiraceae bacterium]|nr:exodeoxyribonuclease VII large subunit [Lachnospiraceae bacterium]
MIKNVYSVSQVNKYVKNMFAQDFLLNRIYVKGELSNCKYHTSGHVYFTLKDQGGTINGVMFASNVRSLKFRMESGQSVIVLGSVQVFEKTGAYQLYAREVVLDGEGVLYQKFAALKQELEEMGMFDSMYKKPIPKYVHTVGVVTAKTGAAIQDIINITHRRNPYVQLVLCPVLVQGEDAPRSIVEGIYQMEQVKPDVMIVGRGGGSLEDLWAFNEKEVAKAIFDCSIPIISAVGHETDTTIADMVADLRAPTPSAAAELAVFDVEQFFAKVDRMEFALNQRMQMVLEQKKHALLDKKMRLEKESPVNRLNDHRMRCVDYEETLDRLMKDKVTSYRHKLELLAGTLDGLSPLKKLSQGLSYVEDVKGTAIHSVAQVKEGDSLNVHVMDGDIMVKVTDVKEKSDGR